MNSFKANETWVSGCMSCTCEEQSLTVSCMNLPCHKPEPVDCNKPGLVKVLQTVDCCQYEICGEFTHFSQFQHRIMWKHAK